MYTGFPPALANCSSKITFYDMKGSQYVGWGNWLKSKPCILCQMRQSTTGENIKNITMH